MKQRPRFYDLARISHSGCEFRAVRLWWAADRREERRL
jgi:hypothetical protein